jgi:hypothetical protein
MAKYAVCVGINDYPGSGSDLSGCINDANDWEAELTKRQFSVVKLIDKKATKKAISAALGETIDKAVKGDSIVFTYSGHGSWQPDRNGDEEDGRDEGWCPHDLGSAGLLLDDEMYTIFGRLALGTKLVMLSDSCHSGSVARMAQPALEADKGLKIRFLPPEKFLKPSALRIADRIRKVVGRGSAKPDRCLLISGCRDHEYSYDASFGGRPNGAFTFFALRTLKKLKPTATYLDWHKEIRKALPSMSHPQTPVLSGLTSMKKWKALS